MERGSVLFLLSSFVSRFSILCGGPFLCLLMLLDRCAAHLTRHSAFMAQESLLLPCHPKPHLYTKFQKKKNKWKIAQRETTLRRPSLQRRCAMGERLIPIRNCGVTVTLQIQYFLIRHFRRIERSNTFLVCRCCLVTTASFQREGINAPCAQARFFGIVCVESKRATPHPMPKLPEMDHTGENSNS